LSDLRTHSLDIVLAWLRDRAAWDRFDLIVYAGDDVARFRPNTSTNYFELFAAESTFGLVAVTGNDDAPAARALIRGRKVYNVHERPVRLGSAVIMGLDGAPDIASPKAPWGGLGATLHTEREIARHLVRQRATAPAARALLVSHAPPAGVLDEAIRFGYNRIGSAALRDFCTHTATPPDIVVSGHAHHCGGQSAMLERTTVINIASHDGSGAPIRYAEFEWNVRRGGRPRELVMDTITLNADLQRVHGIGNGLGLALVAGGITTVRELAAAAPEAVGQILGWRPERARSFCVRARALLEARPITIAPLPGPSGPRVFFDIETDSAWGTRYVWLVSCLDEEIGELRQFFAPTPSASGSMLREFATYCEARIGHAFIAYSGCNYDQSRLVDHFSRHGIPTPVAITRAVDGLQAVRRSIALPCPSFGLKEAAAVFGFRFRHPGLDGLAVASAYEDAVRRAKPVPRFLFEYAEDDVRGLAHLVQSVERV
jgi:Icc-related predicted phosphoesterase